MASKGKDMSFITQQDQAEIVNDSPAKLTATHMSSFSKESVQPEFDREAFLMSLFNKVSTEEMPVEELIS